MFVPDSVCKWVCLFFLGLGPLLHARLWIGSRIELGQLADEGSVGVVSDRLNREQRRPRAEPSTEGVSVFLSRLAKKMFFFHELILVRTVTRFQVLYVLALVLFFWIYCSLPAMCVIGVSVTTNPPNVLQRRLSISR